MIAPQKIKGKCKGVVPEASFQAGNTEAAASMCKS